MREIQILKQLSIMPNNHFIPKLLTVMKNEESIFLVMELKRCDLASLFTE